MRAKIMSIIQYMSGCKLEDLNPEARLVEDLGLDELDQVELIMALEEKFSIEISDKEIQAVKTVEELVQLVNGKI